MTYRETPVHVEMAREFSAEALEQIASSAELFAKLCKMNMGGKWQGDYVAPTLAFTKLAEACREVLALQAND